MIAVTKKFNGQWWGGKRYGTYIKYSRIYIGESAEILDLLEKYGALK